jgi:hypothetical protein
MRWRIGLVAVMVTAGPAIVLVGSTTPAAAASVPGITVVYQDSATDSNDKTVTAKCPNGTKVMDAGGYVDSGGGKVTLDDVFPDPDLNFVNVTGLETDSFSGQWTIRAYVTCADLLDGQEWIDAQTATNSDDRKTLTVACSSNKTVLGSGYTITGGDGEVTVDEATPNGGLGAPATEVRLIAKETDPFDGKWQLDGFVICADELPGQQVLVASTGSNSGDKGTFVSCGSQVATGSTAELVAGEGEVLLTSDYSADKSSGTVRGEENDGTTGSWSANTYVFCADK